MNGWNERNDWPVGPPCGIDDRRDAACRRACRSRAFGRQSVPSTRSPSRAVTTTRSRGRGTRAGASAARRTAGIESVTWRGRASSGATPGTGSSHRSCGAVSRSPTAAIHAPSASQPTDSPDAVPRVDPAARSPRRVTVRGVFGGRPRPRFGARPPSSSPTTQVLEAVVDLDVDEAAPSGDGSGADSRRRRPARRARARPRSGRSGRGRRRSAGRPGTSRRHPRRSSSEPSGQPAGADIDAPLAGDDPRRRRVATSTIAICAVSLDVRPALGHDRHPARRRAPTRRRRRRRRLSVRTVGRGGFGSVAGRPRRGTGASISQTCVQPRRRDRKASRWPSGDQRGSRPPPGLPTTRASAASRRPRRPRSPRRGRTRAGGRRATTAGRRRASPRRSAGPDIRRGATSVKSWRAPAASACRRRRGRAGGAGTRAAASTATIASTVRFGDGVVGAVGIRPWSSRDEDLDAASPTSLRDPSGRSRPVDRGVRSPARAAPTDASSWSPSSTVRR